MYLSVYNKTIIKNVIEQQVYVKTMYTCLLGHDVCPILCLLYLLCSTAQQQTISNKQSKHNTNKYTYIIEIIVLHLQVHFDIGTQIRGSLLSTSRIHTSHVHVLIRFRLRHNALLTWLKFNSSCTVINTL